MSAFVGADITTALLVSGICSKPDTRMLVDIGTNGEIALWHRGQLSCCSTAAGPAFEGAGLSMGMAGKTGAVDHVRVQDGALQAHVIGGGAPKGICGSGVIDALACLLELEQLDETGLLEQDPAPVAPPVCLTQKDVRMVQLAKSAICAGLSTLLRVEGLERRGHAFAEQGLYPPQRGPGCRSEDGGPFHQRGIHERLYRRYVFLTLPKGLAKNVPVLYTVAYTIAYCAAHFRGSG